MKHLTAITIFLTFCLSILLAQGVLGQAGNQSPFVSNVTVQQRAGTKLVDIAYDVEASGGTLLTITVAISNDGGKTFNVPASTFTGDVGVGIAPGRGKKIVWNAGADVPNVYGTNYQAKITAIGCDDTPATNEVEVIIGDKEASTWGPFPGSLREYGLMQYLYYSNEIGTKGKIVKIAVMPSAATEKSFTNVRIYMSMVNRDELSNIVAENYEGPKPAPSAIIPSIKYGGADNKDNWTEFTLNTPFEYDGNKNLLIAFESSADKNDRNAVASYIFNAGLGNKKRWLDLRTSDGTTANPNPGALRLKITFLVP